MKNFQNIRSIYGYKNRIQYDFNRQIFYGTTANENEIFESPIKRSNYIKKENIFLTPSLITNAIIDLDERTDKVYINKIFQILEIFLCKHIVINILTVVDLLFIEKLIKSINDINLHEVLILFRYSDELYSDNFGNIVTCSNRIKSAIIFESPFEKNFENLMHFTVKKKEIKNTKSLNEFNSNHILFSESQLHHTYFNRKLYIGPTGEIKNAPETEQVFGYIQDITEDELKEIISSPHFQKYWFVHKGLIDVCKECEFRHMCVDNRVPIERKSNEWYNSLECNYNPYIGKWEGEEGYLSLADCGVISNEIGFIIDHEKVRKINSLSEQY